MRAIHASEPESEYSARYWDVQHEVNLEIKRRFDAEGLEFAFPTQTIHLEH